MWRSHRREIGGVMTEDDILAEMIEFYLEIGNEDFFED